MMASTTTTRFGMIIHILLLLGVLLQHSECAINLPNVSLPNLPNLPKTPKIAVPFDGGEKCYDDLGCFPRFPPSSIFSKLASLIGLGLYPDTPEGIDVTYVLYSCTNRYRPWYLYWNSSLDEVREAPFDPRKRTVLLIHGYTDGYQEMNWMGDLKDFIMNIKTRIDLEEGICNFNVIGVDWSQGAKTIIYPQAVANTQLVGAAVAKLIKQLIEIYPRTSPADFTIVGHSLGAHTSGFVGTHFANGTKLRNIIGLDPAGPGFHDVPNAFRLDPSDASLVLTLHTNGGKLIGDSFGIVDPLGHYAFYPNGGSDQPGCEVTRGITNVLLDGLFKGLSDTIACSHRRATILVQFNESLITTAESMAYACSSYEDFAAGKCGNCFENPNGCKPFGGWFDYWQYYQLPRNWTAPVRYYIDTTDMKPYSMYHHQMVIRTKRNFTSFKGYIKVTPVGEKRDAEQIKIDPGTIKPNSTYTSLIKVPKTLGLITRALVRVKNNGLSIASIIGFEGETYNPMEVIEEIRFNFMSNEALRIREAKSTILVPTNQTQTYRIRKKGYVFVPKKKTSGGGLKRRGNEVREPASYNNNAEEHL